MFIHSYKIETLEQASQLAQDIETSLTFSTERRGMPKAGEQPSPSTHTTRDPKKKICDSESSRNVKIVNILSAKAIVYCCIVSL